MSIDEMRKAMQEFCRKARSHCPDCPVVVIHGLCEKYDWPDAPEDLVKKAFLLAFGEIKEDEQMNITADDIRKAALELIGDAAQCEYEYSGADALSAKVTIGYIIGAKDFAEKMIEMIEGDEAE